MAKVAVRRSVTPIANMVLHVDASSGVYTDAGATEATDGQTVQQWSDLSGAGNHVTQAAADNRPTYRATGFNGQPGVDFLPPSFYGIWAETPEFLGAGYDTACTLFWIGESAGANNQMALSSNGVGLGNLNEWGRFDVANLGVPVTVYHGAQTLGTNIRCVGMSYDGTTLRTIINGHLITLARTGNLGLSGDVTLGDFAARAGIGQLRGCIAEAYAWNAAATDAQMRAMCNTLLAKWGLSVPSTRKVVCASGDSQTAYTGAAGMWPSVIAADLGTAAQGFTTVAQGGVTLAFINEIAAVWIDPVYDATAANNVNIIWSGTNDLAGGTSGADTYALLATYCNARRAAGWDKLIVVTALPRSAAGDAANHETLRQAFNTLLRANWATIADGLADVAADGRIGDEGDELDTTYYQADRVHLNTAGQAVIAGIMQPVVEGVL